MSSSCSIPDVDAEKASLDPDSISFMETLMSRECGQVGLQNGFSPTSFEGGHSEDKETTPIPPEQICPVGLHKAVLLYPLTAQTSDSYSHSAERLSVTFLFTDTVA